MREQCIGDRRAVGQVKRGGKLMAAFAFELELFRRHGMSP